MTGHTRVGTCKVCNEQREIRFMNICNKCYKHQMKEIRAKGTQWAIKKH